MIPLSRLRELLGDEAEGLTDEDLEAFRGFLYLLAEEAVESIERDQHNHAA